ncbi:DUF6907 domain-containing protein [Streptomyces sp. NPDC004111]|uniref:DUF6907 domain-containing protein n=1 Tax=Streptomyces sp. NPDC004111 TaxID=3364690 RepID=UPI0036BE139C
MILNTVTCPAWCVEDHGYYFPEDVFHRSAAARLTPDGSRSGRSGPWQLVAHVVVPEVAQDGEPGLLVIDTQAGVCGPSVELAAEQVDEFIRQSKAFLARVEQMRDQLASIKEGRS